MKSELQSFRGAILLASLRDRLRQVPAGLQQQARSRDFRVNAAVLLVLAMLVLIDVRGLAGVLLGLGALVALTVEQLRRQRAKAADPVDAASASPRSAAQPRRPQEES